MTLKDAIPWGNQPRTLAWQPLDSLHVLACPRVSVASVQHLLPAKYIEAMQNAPEPCCREVPNLDIEAWYSGPADQAKGVPDIYKIHCKTCERCHVRFCVGGNHPTDPTKKDKRPFWERR
jgi:hypothetical protein